MAEKKTTKKKAPAKKPVAKKSKLTFDTFPFDELLKICKKDVVVAEKMQQLISDYSFEKDETERQRCISIAFGNWRHGSEFDTGLGDKESFEEHNFKKCQKILKKLVG